MEVQMDCDEEVVENIIPKVERPDTPASVKNDSYDENEFNPPSPKEADNDGYDAGLTAQVFITSVPLIHHITQSLWLVFSGHIDATGGS